MASAIASYLGSSLLTEWDARDLTLSNNDPVGTWAKSAASTEGNDLSQATPGFKPLFKTGAYPYVQFDGTDDRMTATMVTSPSVYFVVCEAVSDGTTRSVLGTISGGNYMFNYLAGGTLTSAFVGTTPSTSPAAISWPNSTKIEIAFVATAINVGFISSVFSNLQIVTAVPSQSVLTLGGFNSGSSYPWSGKVYHALTASLISKEKIARALAILRDEWGIAGDPPEPSSGGGTAGFTGIRKRG